MKISIASIFAEKTPFGVVVYFFKKFIGIALAQILLGVAIMLLGFTLPEANARIIGTFIPHRDYFSAILWLTAALVTVVILLGLQLIQQRVASIVAEKLTCVFQRFTLRRCMSLPMQWHLVNGPATANRSFFYDISNITSMASNIIGMGVFPVLQVIIVIGLMLYLNLSLALVSLVPLIMIGIASWKSTKVLPPAATAQIMKGNLLGGMFFDFISCIRMVKALCIEAAVVHEMKPSIEAAAKANRNLSNLNDLFTFISGVAVSFGGLFVLAASLFLHAKDKIDLTDLLRFIFFAALLYQPFERLSHFIQIYIQANGSWINMRSSLSGSYLNECRYKLKSSFPKSGSIVAENISFEYNSRTILKSVSIRAEEGEVIGIMGRSGGGKSTLLSIISGYLAPQSGSVRIGSLNLNQIYLKDLRKNIFYAGQDALIFNRSIRFNLFMASPNSPEDKIWEALEYAGLRQTVENFPSKLEHIVGDHGTILSGGERQRLLVAIAWLRNPRILLLDEITASLDAITDQQVRESIQQLMNGRTTIIVSHRLENFAQANRVYILEKGGILAEGTHFSLLETCPFYQQICKARAL